MLSSIQSGNEIEGLYLSWTMLAIVAVFSLFDLYRDYRRKDIQTLICSVVTSMVVVYLVLLAISVAASLSSEHQISILSLMIIETVLLSLSRSIYWLAGKKLAGKKKVIIICGNQEAGEAIAEKLYNHNRGWFQVKRILIVEPLQKFQALNEDFDLYVISPEVDIEVRHEILQSSLMLGKEVIIVPELADLTMRGAVFQQIDDMPVLSIPPFNLSTNDKRLKRMLDIILSLTFLFCVSPIILLIYLLIPLTSKGPAIYKQERVGLNGEAFWIYKFRSMIQEAETETGPVLASEKDPRVTPFGKFLRGCRLDEVPQLFNVIKGEMSLVGPRPERDFFTNQFEQTMPHYTYRFTVKPGVTGLAQVLANYTTSAEDKLRYDLLYIHNYSLMLDFKIMLQTIRVVVQPKSSRGTREQGKTDKHLTEI